MHGDVWQRIGTESRLVVLSVCGHHDPPHVSGHWLSEHDGSPTCHFATYPLDRFLKAFEFQESQL